MDDHTTQSLAERAAELGRLAFGAIDLAAALGVSKTDLVTLQDGAVWKAYMAARVESQIELRRNLAEKASVRVGAVKQLLSLHRQGDDELEVVAATGEVRPVGATAILQQRAVQQLDEEKHTLKLAARRRRRAALK